MLLAIDPATKTGWRTKDASGTMNFAIKKGEASSARVRKFRDWLVTMLDSGVTFVAYEKPCGGMFEATRVGSQLEAIIMLMCEDYGAGYYGFSAGEIKKHATGKGNAKKDAMIAACVEKLGITTVCDNEADACWIYDLSLKRLTFKDA